MKSTSRSTKAEDNHQPLPDQAILPEDEGATTPPAARPVEPAAPAPTACDIPGFDDLPADVRERLLKIRRDPTQPDEVSGPPPQIPVRVGNPGRDDIIRTYPTAAGWLDVHVVNVKKGMGNDTETYLVSGAALTNPAVRERARPGWAILTLTAEGVVAVWIIKKPDQVHYKMGYSYDHPKYEAATAARTEWVTVSYDAGIGGHRWQVIDLSGNVNANPKWPAEKPMVLIFRAIEAIHIEDPAFEGFKYLTARKANVHE
jgi:hypothetical protein